MKGSKGDGVEKDGKHLTSFGKDDSDVALPHGRGKPMGGSITNISHSITSGSANQKGS